MSRLGLFFKVIKMSVEFIVYDNSISISYFTAYIRSKFELIWNITTGNRSTISIYMSAKNNISEKNES